jgi:DNA invertase Pin-like site-specific DNA recombinase
VIARLLEDVRAGDVIVIWKLDRLGRSLKHLIDVVGLLLQREVGLRSLNDPVDTTTAQGRLVFNLFASLAEFERDVIRERTQAGLTAARVRGRKGGASERIAGESRTDGLRG